MASRQPFPWLFALSVALLPVLYWPTLNAGMFPVDDHAQLSQPYIASGISWASIESAFRIGSYVDYYPLRDLSYGLDYSLFGPHPFGFRVHQLLLFAGLAMALYGIMLISGVERKTASGLAAVWTLHPIHAEMIAWLSARKDVQSLMWGALSVLCFLFGVKRGKSRFLVLAAFAFIFSLLAKASLALLPLVAAAASLSGEKRLRDVRPAIAILACATIGIGFAALTGWYYSSVNDMRVSLPLGFRFWASASALGKSALGWVWPPLNVIDVDNLGDWLNYNERYAIVGALAGAGCIGAGIYCWRKRLRALAYLFSAIVLLYLPVCGLVFPRRQFYSVRYIEPMMIATFVALGLILGRKRTLNWVFPALLAICASLTSSEAGLWSDPTQVIEKAVRDQPESLSLKVLKYDVVRNQAPGLRGEIEARCTGAAPENHFECTRYWKVRYLETLDERIFRLATEDSEMSRADTLFHSLQNGTLQESELALWSEGLKWKTLPSVRILGWISDCLNLGPERARRDLHDLKSRLLVSSEDVDRIFRGAVQKRYADILRGCIDY